MECYDDKQWLQFISAAIFFSSHQVSDFTLGTAVAAVAAPASPSRVNTFFAFENTVELPSSGALSATASGNHGPPLKSVFNKPCKALLLPLPITQELKAMRSQAAMQPQRYYKS
ncbi:hypothetical protein PoB_005049600 [Plakobranchus ocellatus]|uniref:Uncharacterized protein n=1 Tax=Plakobranchus ocellatus TaxID=259542 RepID=A0AAV4BU30_9GAST|nr:hypothetical protein PoB_005049600 [Plakobranchus ocellatus]